MIFYLVVSLLYLHLIGSFKAISRTVKYAIFHVILSKFVGTIFALIKIKTVIC